MARRLPYLQSKAEGLAKGLTGLFAKLSAKSLQKEDTPMEAKAAHKARSPRERAIENLGICAACTNLAICRYPKSTKSPVLFCEEFSSSKGKPRRKESAPDPVLVKIPTQNAVNKEKFSINYIGLCKHCEKLYACRLTKPGGGTWSCEFFEERKTAK